MMPPLVSVLMTAYNREKYIGEAIESVLASSYSNFEFIIVDDCSSDNTVAIARKYEASNRRIKVYCNASNLGQFGNRNKAASYAKGEFLKYVDSDDLIYPYTLQVMVDGMQQYPEAALGFCVTNEIIEDTLPCQINSPTAIRKHYLKGGLLFVGPSGLLIKRSAFESVNGFQEFGMPSDNHLSLKIACRFPVVAMSKNLFWWRQHKQQVFSENKGNYSNILNNYQFSKDIISNYSPLAVSENRIIRNNLKKIFFSHIFRLIFKKVKPGVALKLLIQFAKVNSLKDI